MAGDTEEGRWPGKALRRENIQDLAVIMRKKKDIQKNSSSRFKATRHCVIPLLETANREGALWYMHRRTGLSLLTR